MFRPAPGRASFRNRTVQRLSFGLLGGIAVLASVGSVSAQNLPADTVTANDALARWGHSSCTASLPELSDGSISNPGVCFLPPVDPDYRMTFTFSPANDQFMTGINIWANAGNSMSDHELRQLDVEVDYFDPTTNSTETLQLDDVDIGDTIGFNDPRLVSFGGGTGLYRVSEVRIDDLVGLSENGRVVFRELQGVFATRPVSPEIAISSSESGAVADGGTDAQGTELAGAAKTVTFTVSNTGTDVLTFGGPPSVADETNLAGAVAVGPYGASGLAPGESTTFDVTYTPAADGPFGFVMQVPNNDSDEGAYEIAVSGVANEAPSVELASSLLASGGGFLVTATFSEAVVGMEADDFEVGNAVMSGFANPSADVYTIEVTPTDPALPIVVEVRANAVTDADGAPNAASSALSVLFLGTPTPVEIEELEAIIVEETVRDLRNGIRFNQRAVRDARARHAEYLRCRDLERDLQGRAAEEAHEVPEGCSDLVARDVAPVFDAEISATEDGVAGSGSFFSGRASHGGAQRRLVFGELSFHHYDDGDTAAAFDGRVAWERLVRDDVLLGLFVGANATFSDIEDSFSGTRTGYGVNAGAYFVDRITDNLYFDGFVSAGLGGNELDLGNGTLEVDGSYDTTSVQAGLSLAGQYSFQRFELHPEFSVAYGIASVGDADLVFSSAMGGSTETLSVDDVAVGLARFRPEFVFATDMASADITQSELAIAPSLLCETVRAGATRTDCGGGLELNWTVKSSDGLATLSANASREIVGGSTRDQLSVAFERRF